MKKIYSIFKYIFLITAFLLFNTNVSANNFVINGNQYSDKEAIISIIGSIPDIDDKSITNYILKKFELFQSFKIWTIVLLAQKILKLVKFH